MKNDPRLDQLHDLKEVKVAPRKPEEPDEFLLGIGSIYEITPDLKDRSDTDPKSS